MEGISLGFHNFLPTEYVDVFTTAIFLVGMWLMAKRKIENWLFWILGDVISVPLYFKKGMLFTLSSLIIEVEEGFYFAKKDRRGSGIGVLFH